MLVVVVLPVVMGVAGVVRAGSGGVDEDGGVPPVELLKDPVERCVTEIGAVVIRLESNSGGSEGVEGVGDLGQGAVDVGKRNRGEESKFLGPPFAEIRGEFVALPDELAGCGRVAGHEVHPG